MPRRFALGLSRSDSPDTLTSLTRLPARIAAGSCHAWLAVESSELVRGRLVRVWLLRAGWLVAQCGGWLAVGWLGGVVGWFGGGGWVVAGSVVGWVVLVRVSPGVHLRQPCFLVAPTLAAQAGTGGRLGHSSCISRGLRQILAVAGRGWAPWCRLWLGASRSQTRH